MRPFLFSSNTQLGLRLKIQIEGKIIIEKKISNPSIKRNNRNFISTSTLANVINTQDPNSLEKIVIHKL